MSTSSTCLGCGAACSAAPGPCASCTPFEKALQVEAARLNRKRLARFHSIPAVAPANGGAGFGPPTAANATGTVGTQPSQPAGKAGSAPQSSSDVPSKVAVHPHGPPCDRCGTFFAAAGCVTCNLRLCDTCWPVVHMLRLADHQRAELPLAVGASDVRMCPTHKAPYTLYCMHCQAPVCVQDAARGGCRRHETVELSEQEATLRQRMAHCADTLASRRSAWAAARSGMVDRAEAARQRGVEAVSAIEELRRRLFEAVNTRCDSLLRDAEFEWNRRRSLLRAQVDGAGAVVQGLERAVSDATVNAAELPLYDQQR